MTPLSDGLPNECTCTVDRGCSVHGEAWARRSAPAQALPDQRAAIDRTARRVIDYLLLRAGWAPSSEMKAFVTDELRALLKALEPPDGSGTDSDMSSTLSAEQSRSARE